jgi:hypothetical protein
LFRICHLLETWIKDYPHDFAVPRTAGALSALVKSIISKTYLLHYGSELLPFLELLPQLVDTDATWAQEPEETPEEADDSNSLFEEDTLAGSTLDHSSHISDDIPHKKAELSLSTTTQRERKASIPLSFIGTSNSGHLDTEASEKQQMKDLVRLSQDILSLDPDDIAQEITRVEVKYFLDIKVNCSVDSR